MIKKWIVECKVNMDMSNVQTLTIKANSKRKAEIIAEEKCINKGYFSAEAISCTEVIDGK